MNKADPQTIANKYQVSVEVHPLFHEHALPSIANKRPTFFDIELFLCMKPPLKKIKCKKID